MIKWLILLCLLSTMAIAEPVAYVTTPTLNIVQIDLNCPTVGVQVVGKRTGTEAFGSMVNRIKPAAAINGGFFCLRSLKPIGDLRTSSFTCYGSYGYDLVADGNKVRFLERQDARECKGYLLGLGPRMLWKGEIICNPKAEGFTSSVHVSKQKRTAIGMKANNKLVLAVARSPMLLSDMARSLKAYGCVTAFGLDGGSSTGLYCNGKFIRGPGRAVSNFVITLK